MNKNFKKFIWGQLIKQYLYIDYNYESKKHGCYSSILTNNYQRRYQRCDVY